MPSWKHQIVDRLGISRVAAAVDVVAADLTRLQHQVDHLTALQRPSTLSRIALNTVLVGTLAAPPTMISIVLPTRNRSQLLRRALSSVLAQHHRRWQLVVVDDASGDDTPDVVAAAQAEVQQPRTGEIIYMRGEGHGSAAARNLGLTRVNGDWVTFLDDDNVLDPNWLHAIAVFADRYPATEVLYGAQIRQAEPTTAEEFPEAYLLFPQPLYPESLFTDNTIDLGMIAARAGTGELRFDDSLKRFVDWDLVVRLFASVPFRAVPVWSSVYTTEAAKRITHTSDQAEIAAFRHRLKNDPALADARAAIASLSATVATGN